MNKDELYILIIGSIFSGLILINIIRCYLCNKKIIVEEKIIIPKPKDGFNSIPEAWANV
jgi:hypothetical protein